MKIFTDNNIDLKNPALILGFFDGIHLGHQKVIKTATDYACKLGKPIALITFKNSPSEYFKKDFQYIYPRKISYEKISQLGVDYIIELDFEKLADITAKEYLKNLIEKYSPISISTGFNHTFGKNKLGDSEFLKASQTIYNYKYHCTPPVEIENILVCSTIIKEFISKGEIIKANKLLGSPFLLEGPVIQGAKIGRKIGFPTANIEYPKDIVKLPFGVYAIRTLNQVSVMNWGIKPTFNAKEPVLEIHIPNHNTDLYDQILQIEVLKKIRDEKKFESTEDLKIQIKKDIEECLKL